MEILTKDGASLIKLEGFNIGGEILLSDAKRIGEYEKVTVLLPTDYLKFLIEEGTIEIKS